MQHCLTCLILAALANSTPAMAQTMMANPAQWYINNQIYSTRVFNSAIANSMAGRRADAPARGRPVRGAASPIEPTRYRESPTSPLPAILAANSDGIGRNRDEASRAFASYITLYKENARSDGFPHNDLAYAYTYFVVSNYRIYHDLMDVPYEKDPRALRASDGFDRITAMGNKRVLQVKRERIAAVYEHFRAQLSSNAPILKMTDAQKQEAAELIATLSGVNRAAYLAGIDAMNERQTQLGRDLARAGLEKLLAVPVSQIEITTGGLVLAPR